MPSGHLTLWVFAGEPPCWIGYAQPSCVVPGANGSAEDREPTHGCTLHLDVARGDDVTILLDRLPVRLQGQLDYPACPVR